MNQSELYSILNAKSDEDILRHFPSHYESLSITPFSLEPDDGQRFVFKGTVSKLRTINARNISMVRFQFSLLGNRNISCVLYNQTYYINKLSANKDLCIVCYYSDARKAYSVQSIYDIDSYYVMTGLKPVYNLPKSVSQSYFASVIKKILSYPRESSYMISKLPNHLIEKYRFMNSYDAYRCVHLPRNEKDLNNGLRLFKFEEALSYCIKSLSIRNEVNKRKKEGNNSISHQKINSFVSSLSYKLTVDQNKAIKDIVLDMEKDSVMHRLLQGDVGTGKTIVAFVSIYANYLRGRQSVLMAPTFELAMQHYQNAIKVFAAYKDIHIELLAGNNLTAKKKRDVLSDLENGYIQVLISTHSVISDNVKFKNLGLTIIDEQQLFGVKQRETLLLKSEINDMLMMSATPIPRTLSMIINADLDVSTLSMYPHGRRDVTSKVIRSSDPIIFKAIDKALAANRQIFIVTPKISEGSNKSSAAEEVFKEFSERYPNKVQLLHGKIKKETQDSIIKAFSDNSKPILVSTTVIQVGIDVSSACLLIIYDANYFGLSSLHQLRGRIGRSGEFSLALLVYDGNDSKAKEKLEFLANSNDGLEISQFDLKQRGTGSYAGTEQSGESELTVCNFVEDLTLFEYAKKDAEYILSHPEEEQNSSYLKTIDLEKDLNIT